jgi:hypothetical protein
VVLTLDASLEESHSSKAPATDFEVEDGYNISDFQIIKPFMLTLTGVISPPGITQAAGTALNVVNNASAIFSALTGNPSPSVAAYLQLIQIQNQRQSVQVVTSLNAPFQSNSQVPALYDNMFIEEITVPRDAETGNCLLFDVVLKQLKLVSPSQISISLLTNPDASLQQALKSSQSTGPLNGFNLGYKASGGGTPVIGGAGAIH